MVFLFSSRKAGAGGYGVSIMRFVVLDWIQFIERAGSLLGLVFIALGAVFMLSGWRLARIAMVATYMLIGISAGIVFAPDSIGRILTALVLAGVVGGIGYLLKDRAGPVLAGLLGSLTIWTILGSSTVPAPTIYIVLVMIFVAITATALSNRVATSVYLTSFVGGMFIASGLVSLIMASTAIAPHFRGMSKSAVFYPFLIIVPTVCGVMLQLGDAKSRGH